MMPVMPQGGGQVPVPAGPGGDPEQRFRDLLASLGMTEADFASLQSANAFPEQSGVLGQDMSMADRLRNTPMPDMRHAGRVSVAASPLEAAATMLQRIRGQKDYEGARGKMDAMIGQLGPARTVAAKQQMFDAAGDDAARRSLIDLLRKGHGAEPPELLARPDWQY